MHVPLAPLFCDYKFFFGPVVAKFCNIRAVALPHIRKFPFMIELALLFHRNMAAKKAWWCELYLASGLVALCNTIPLHIVVCIGK
jgi:hypothetical protein